MTPVTRDRTYGWRNSSDALRDLALGATIGILVLAIEVGAQDQLPSFRAVLRNAVLGMFILAGARGVETALSWAIEQSQYPTFFRTVVYAVGGWIGYFAGVATAWMAFGRESRDLDLAGFHFFYAIAISAFISILVGLILHHNRKRNDRLRLSIERLKEHEFAEKELQIARDMQERLLPPANIEEQGYRVTARAHAAHLVGGDFYDVIRLEDGAVAVLAADVSGKGIAASLLMASCKAAVPFLASAGSAAEVMTRLNRTLADQLQRREFVAMVFCRFVPETGIVDLVNAGMPDPMLMRPGSTIEPIVSAGERLPLGSMRKTVYESTRLTLAPADRLLLFSDGLPEAVTSDGPLGYERMGALIQSSSGVDEILEKIRLTADLIIEDDLTLVMLERK